MNYIVIEERENYQTLQEFNSLIRTNKEIENKNEKVIYLLFQAIEMAKQLTTGAQILNYNIHPVNLIITDQWQLKLIDFSTVDMIHPLSHSKRRNTADSDSFTEPEI